MKLLAFSDIHHNLVAVRKLRAFENNSFDAIIVAGDIGSKSASEFFKILTTFKCPVLYVYGNWDNELGYRKSYGPSCQLIQSNIVTVGKFHFAGFSGCPTHWGQNPIARRLYRTIKQPHKSVSDAHSEILRLNRESIGKVARKAKIDSRRCIVITHERLTRLSQELPGTLLHLFGHIHNFSDRDFKGTKYINVATLDRPISARPRTKNNWKTEDCRNFNAGNYVTIEINSSLEVSARCVTLPHEYKNWIPLENNRYNGIRWIPEEDKWTNESDPPIPQYWVSRSPRTIKSNALA
jgi:predicted phosphodiesterase